MPNYGKIHYPNDTKGITNGKPTHVVDRDKSYGDFEKDLHTGLKESTIIIAPVPDQSYEVELHYLYKPNSLVTDTTGTWISEHARNALLYGCLVEAYTYMKGEPDLLTLYENRFQQEVARLKNKAEARGRRDEYRYDSLRTQVT